MVDRRVAWLVVVLLAAWAGIGRADAQQVPDYSGCSSIDSWCPSEQAAYASVNARATANRNGQSNPSQFKLCPAQRAGPLTSQAYGQYFRVRVIVDWATGACTNGVSAFQSSWLASASCPRGVDPVTLQCYPTEQECKAKPNLGPMAVAGTMAGGSCSGGCKFTPGGTSLQAGVGIQATTYAPYWEPSGESCSVGPESPAPSENPQECIPAGDGQTMCLKANGDHCYSGSPGRQICWKPGETGQKTDGEIAQTRDPGETPQPPTQPDNGDTLTQEGEPVTTTTTTSGGRNIITTTTNYSTGSGADAGDSNSGQPGDGSGNGDGEGDDDGEGGSVAGDGEFPRLDGADGRTLSGVLSAYRTRISASPLVSAATGFFQVNTAGGSCPVWTLPGTDYTPAVTMDFWCVSELSATWQWFGVVMIIVFGWCAFKIGML